MNITLPSDVEQALVSQARRQGTVPEKLAIEALRDRFVSSKEGEVPAEEPHETLADYLKDYVGVVCSSEYVSDGAAMSEDTGRKFTAGLLRRRRQGRL